LSLRDDLVANARWLADSLEGETECNAGMAIAMIRELADRVVELKRERDTLRIAAVHVLSSAQFGHGPEVPGSPDRAEVETVAGAALLELERAIMP
jgi:hypothetical protein